MYDTIILGAGASGLFLGKLLKKNYLILEHNDSIGKKIKISGGGKCNITNKFLSPKNYDGKKDFIKRVFIDFDNKDLLNYLKKHNLKVNLLKNSQYFFDSSQVLLNHFKDINVKLNTKVLEVKKNIVYTDKGEFKAKNIVVATGGLSYKKIGATSIGYDIAKELGHRIIDLKPALVGFTIQPQQNWFKNLSGISIFSFVKVGEFIYKNNILFSHRGITGPAILNASLRWEKGYIEIDFLAGKKVLSFLKNPNKQISTQLPLPKRFIKEFLASKNIEDKRVKFLSKKEIETLKELNSYKFAPAGTFGFDRAEVTKGGVDTDEIDEFMRSKIKPNIFFIGEVLNVTGELGGYNFQWAFSSAFKAFKFLSR